MRRRATMRRQRLAQEETVVQISTRGLARPVADEAGAMQGWDGRAGAFARAVDDCAASLLRTIESEIIPRLMLAHRAPDADDGGAAVLPGLPGVAEQVSTLTDIVLHHDPQAAQAYVRELLGAGLTVEHMYLELLAPVARRLGVMWEADLCDFTQVTVGLWRLQQLVHAHAAAFQREAPPARPADRRAMLIAAPGSQHTFGLLMVSEFFRRAGWQVVGDPTLGVDRATAVLRRDWFDMIGLSVGSECHVDAVTSAILAIRQASLNPSLLVLIGGPVVGLVPDFMERVGADATAPDAATAVAMAERLTVARVAAT